MHLIQFYKLKLLSSTQDGLAEPFLEWREKQNPSNTRTGSHRFYPKTVRYVLLVLHRYLCLTNDRFQLEVQDLKIQPLLVALHLTASGCPNVRLQPGQIKGCLRGHTDQCHLSAWIAVTCYGQTAILKTVLPVPLKNKSFRTEWGAFWKK